MFRPTKVRFVPIFHNQNRKEERMKRTAILSFCVCLYTALFSMPLMVPIVTAQPAGGSATPPALPKALDKPAVVASAISEVEWAALVEQAKKEGSVVIFAGPLAQARTAIMEAFRQKYGISLDIVMGKGEEMVAKLDNERRAGIYSVDMGILGMTTFFNSIKPRGVTIPIKPLLLLPDVQDVSKWRQGKLPMGDLDGHLAVLGVTSVPHMIVNTQMVKEGEIVTHNDLLNPKWRGKIAINDPSASGNGAEWFTFVVREMMGIEKGTAFMKELVKQEPVLTRDQRLLTEWVARGKYAIALAPDSATTADFTNAGAPIVFPDLKEPRPTGSGPCNILVFDKAPHPNATKLFVNWLLSQEGSTIFSKGSGYASTRADVPTDWILPMQVPAPTDIILGEEYQLAKGEMRKLAAEVFRDSIK
jgi:iron(III) transport system substrate-binding protein